MGVLRPGCVAFHALVEDVALSVFSAPTACRGWSGTRARGGPPLSWEQPLPSPQGRAGACWWCPHFLFTGHLIGWPSDLDQPVSPGRRALRKDLPCRRLRLSPLSAYGRAAREETLGPPDRFLFLHMQPVVAPAQQDGDEFALKQWSKNCPPSGVLPDFANRVLWEGRGARLFARRLWVGARHSLPGRSGPTVFKVH